MVMEKELEIQEHMPVRFMAGPIKECGIVQKINPENRPLIKICLLQNIFFISKITL